ncbi:MAG: response regulator [Dehalococcoidales bacterium]|jgi:DNA-binding NtrC family response regulator
MAKTNILVVDDLRNIRITLGGILEDEGHHVVTVEDGYQTIEAVKKTHFDVIFMDIKLPGINGVQTFREVKKIDPETTVIMMTAYSVEDLIKEAMEEGAYAIIHKPFDIERILAIIQELLKDKVLIMIASHHSENGGKLKAALERLGYRVATALNGGEAIRLVRSRQFDIIFLDSRLPDGDGLDILAQVKKIDPTAMVIMMTEAADNLMEQKAAANGAYACLQPPHQVEEALALLENIIKEKPG